MNEQLALSVAKNTELVKKGLSSKVLLVSGSLAFAALPGTRHFAV